MRLRRLLGVCLVLGCASARSRPPIATTGESGAVASPSDVEPVAASPVAEAPDENQRRATVEEPRARPVDTIVPVVSPPNNTDGWGSDTGTPGWFGCTGFGLVPGARVHAEGLSLTEEADWIRERLASVDEERRALAGCMRKWAKRERKLREQRPVDAEALAELEQHRGRTEAAIERVKAGEQHKRERLREIEATLRERREMIEAGICPQEPCPPGTALQSGRGMTVPTPTSPP